VLFASRKGSRELWPVIPLAALDLDKFLDQRPPAPVQVGKDGLASPFKAKARAALLIG
jgi:hypothetical protein